MQTGKQGILAGTAASCATGFLTFGTNDLEPLPGTTMAKKSLNGVLQHVCLMATVQTDRALSDAELFERFIGQNDEAAFTGLVERHGSVVYGKAICRCKWNLEKQEKKSLACRESR
jgi:hypothetical protein